MTSFTIVLVLLLFPASFAAAQKDPFEPLVRPDAAGQTAEASGQAAIPVPAGGTAQTLPLTGYDFRTPLVMALVLLWAGVVLLLLDRYSRTPLVLR
jgi:hypothetical protein